MDSCSGGRVCGSPISFGSSSPDKEEPPSSSSVSISPLKALEDEVEVVELELELPDPPLPPPEETTVGAEFSAFGVPRILFWARPL